MKRSVWGRELPGATVRPGGVWVGVHAEHTEDAFSALLSLMAYCTYREHSWVYTEPTLAAFFQPLHSNATKLISSPTSVSRSMPKIWTILSMYIIIVNTFCAFKARSRSEEHSSAGQVLLAWADGWMIDVTLGYHKGSSKGYKDPSNWPKELYGAFNTGLTPMQPSNSFSC